MDLAGRIVIVYFSEEGFNELRGLLDLKDKDAGVTGRIVEADEFGVWLSPAGEKWPRTLGAPWKYFRAFDLEPQPQGEA